MKGCGRQVCLQSRVCLTSMRQTFKLTSILRAGIRASGFSAWTQPIDRGAAGPTLLSPSYYYSRMFLEWDHLRVRRFPVDPLCRHTAPPDALAASYLIRGAATGPVQPARPGTLEHFLVERYFLYAQADGRVYQGRVHHRSYPLQPAEVLSLDETLLAAAGCGTPGWARARTLCGRCGRGSLPAATMFGS